MEMVCGECGASGPKAYLKEYDGQWRCDMHSPRNNEKVEMWPRQQGKTATQVVKEMEAAERREALAKEFLKQEDAILRERWKEVAKDWTDSLSTSLAPLQAMLAKQVQKSAPEALRLEAQYKHLEDDRLPALDNPHTWSAGQCVHCGVLFGSVDAKAMPSCPVQILDPLPKAESVSLIDAGKVTATERNCQRPMNMHLVEYIAQDWVVDPADDGVQKSFWIFKRIHSNYLNGILKPEVLIEATYESNPEDIPLVQGHRYIIWAFEGEFAKIGMEVPE